LLTRSAMSNVTSINSVSHVQVSAGVPGPLLDFPELVRFRDLVWTLLSKIYFPRLILPLSSAMSALVDSAFSLGFMLVKRSAGHSWVRASSR
jgi:hypothetical protein